MPTETPRVFLELRYEQAAREYERKLPPEHYMEARPQATQREITLESLAVLRQYRPEVQVFNELLVQYPLPRRKKLGQVVPDNMVVLHPEPLKVEGSYNLPLQPAQPFWVLEYVSRSNKRKDYEDNLLKYEHELKVPYYLLFQPDVQELTLYHHNGEKYSTVVPLEHGRCPIPELALEIGLLRSWVRFWFRGELLPLPGDLVRQLEEKDRLLHEQDRRLEAAESEIARLRTELERLRKTSPGDSGAS
jgi:Uma2 family endonuclease